jgi:15-cis-phytoene synthase
MVSPRVEAGVDGTRVADSYALCRDINRQYGRSYYLATRLLPASKRPYVHALYGFTRWADEIVDAGFEEPAQRERRLKEWAEAFRAGLAGGPVSDPLLPAVIDTIRRFDLDISDFDTFLASMAMDLVVTGYPTYDDLLRYMEGSAAVVGQMMLPILGVAPDADTVAARQAARQLGLAFQLTNFIRDVREDLDRGRVYVPEDDLARFGVDRAILAHDAGRRQTSEPVRALVEYEAGRALSHYAAARAGVDLLERRSRVCIRAAYVLYGEILQEIRRLGYDVMRARVIVPRSRRVALVATASSARMFDAWVARWPPSGATG